jgi:hypothetical protein
MPAVKFFLVAIILTIVAISAIFFVAVSGLLAPRLSLYLDVGGPALSPDEPYTIYMLTGDAERLMFYVEASTTHAWIEFTIERFSKELMLVKDGKIIDAPQSFGGKVAELHMYPFYGFAVAAATDQPGNYEIDLNVVISNIFSRKYSYKIVVVVEPKYVKPYSYEFLLPATMVYTLSHEDRTWIDVTTLDYFISREVEVEPVGISVVYNMTYTDVEVHMPKEVDEETLAMVLEKVASGVYSLTGSKYYSWSRYMKEERKYPVVDLPKLQEFIETYLGVSPTGVLADGVRIVICMPHEVDRTQLEAAVGEFIQQGGVTWSSELEREKGIPTLLKPYNFDYA